MLGGDSQLIAQGTVWCWNRTQTPAYQCALELSNLARADAEEGILRLVLCE